MVSGAAGYCYFCALVGVFGEICHRGDRAIAKPLPDRAAEQLIADLQPIDRFLGVPIPQNRIGAASNPILRTVTVNLVTAQARGKNCNPWNFST